jgi:hypothetical protein
MPVYVIPQDDNTIGTGNPAQQANELSDMEGLLGAIVAAYAGQPGNFSVPADNAANVTTLQTLLNAAYTQPGLAPSGDQSGATDTAAIQALLNLAGKATLQPGTFYVTALQWTASNNLIEGAGWATQLLFNGQVTSALFSVSGTANLSGIVMRDLEIYQTSSSGGGTAVDLSYLQNSKFQNIRIEASGSAGPQYGFNLGGASTYYNLIEDCRVHVTQPGGTGGAVGVNIHSGSNSNIIRNVRIVGDTGTTGLYCNANGIIAERIDMESAGNIGIHADAGSQNFTIINPYLESLTTGIQLESGSGPVSMMGGDLDGCSTEISDLGCVAFLAPNYWFGSHSNATYNTAVGGISSVVKPSNTTVNDSAALAADPALTLNVVANAVYEVKCWVIYSSGTTPNIQFAFTGPSGASLNWTTNSLTTAATGGSGSITVLRSGLGTGNELAAGGGSGSEQIANLEGYLTVGSTAGAFTLYWAQNTANASNTVVYANSVLRLTRIA